MTSHRISNALSSRQRDLRLTGRGGTNLADTRRNRRRHRNHLRGLADRLILHRSERRRGLIHTRPPLRQNTTNLEPNLRRSRGSDRHLTVLDLNLRLRKLQTLHRINRGTRRRRSQRIHRTSTHINLRNNRRHTRRLGDRLGVGHHPVDNRPALGQVRHIDSVPGLRGGGHGHGHLGAVHDEGRLPVVDLFGVVDTRDTRLRGGGRIHRTHTRIHVRDGRHHILGTGRLGDRLGEGEGAISIGDPPFRKIPIINGSTHCRGGSHLDRHLIPGLGELRSRIRDPIGGTNHHGRLRRFRRAWGTHPGSHLDGGQPRIDPIGEGHIEGLQTLNGHLGAVGIRNPIGHAGTGEHRITETDPGNRRNLLGERHDRAIGDVVQGFHSPVALDGQFAGTGGALVLVGPGHRVDGSGIDRATGDGFLQPDVSDGVAGSGTTTRGGLFGAGGTHFTIHETPVDVLGANGNLAFGLDLQVEHVDSVGLEVLTVVVEDGLHLVLVFIDRDIARRHTGATHVIVAFCGINFIPALRGAGDPEDLRVSRGHSEIRPRLLVFVDDGRAGTIGDLGSGNHDTPVDDGRIGTGEPPGLVDLGRDVGFVVDALLPVGKRHLHLRPAVHLKAELGGRRQGDNLGFHPERTADIVLVFDVRIEGADHLAPGDLAGPVGKRISLPALEVEAALGSPQFLRQHDLEGVTGLPGAVRNAPVRIHPDVAPHVDRNIFGAQFREFYTRRVNGCNLIGSGIGTRDHESGQADQKRQEDSQRPPPSAGLFCSQLFLLRHGIVCHQTTAERISFQELSKVDTN